MLKELNDVVNEYIFDASAGLIGFLRYSNIVTWICILGVKNVECCLG